MNNEIIEKGKNITSVQPTVDEINRLLTAYGFENFRIAKAPNQENYYQIQRLDGTEVNNTLSEGEETFISFFAWSTIFTVNLSTLRPIRIRILYTCSRDSYILKNPLVLK